METKTKFLNVVHTVQSPLELKTVNTSARSL